MVFGESSKICCTSTAFDTRESQTINNDDDDDDDIKNNNNNLIGFLHNTRVPKQYFWSQELCKFSKNWLLITKFYNLMH